MTGTTNDQTGYTFDRVVRLTLSTVVLAALFLLVRYLSDVLLPFAAAVVLAYLLNPLVTAFESRTKRRGLAVAMTLGGLGLLALATTAIMVPLVAKQARHFQHNLATLRDDLASSLRAPPAAPANKAPAPAPPAKETPASANDDLSEPVAAVSKTALGWTELTEGWAEYRATADSLSRSDRFAALRRKLSDTYLGGAVDRAVKYADTDEFNKLLVEAAGSIALSGLTVVAFALNIILGLTGLVILVLYTVFLLVDFPEYSRVWKTFLPPKYRDGIVEFLEHFDIAMRRYFRGQAVVAMLTGVGFVIGFTLVGLPMAVPFGLFVGMLNFVPYLQTVGLVPAVALAGLRAVEGDSSFAVSILLTLLVFAVVQIIQDAIITPRIMGKATGLKPVAILLGVFVWGKLLGFLGLVLAIPLTCLGIAYYRRYVLSHPAEDKKPVAA